MPLPHYDRIIFGKCPLRLVIGQIRFPILFRFNERPFLAPFQEAIRPEYPRIEQEHQVAVKFSGRGVEPAGETVWRFSDRERAWSVVLGEGALTLENRRYTSIDDYLARFDKLLCAAAEHLGVGERTRLGLRFINELRPKGAGALTDWARLLNPKFVGFGGAAELLDGTIARAFTELQSTRSDGTLVIRHGLLDGSTVVERTPDAQAPSGPFYLIDLDYFNTTELPLDVSDTLQQMRTYNDGIYQFFRWTLDGGRIFEQLEPR